MIFPQFSLRWLLVATALCGGFFVVLAQAYAGKQWALAACVAAVSLAVAAVAHAAAFAFVWLLCAISAPRQPAASAGVSPFQPPQRSGESPFAPTVPEPKLP